MKKNNSNNINIVIRSLALLLATVGKGSSSFATSEENPSLHQIVADATSFLRKKKSHQDRKGKKCVHDALKELEHGETSAEIGPYINLEYEKLLAVMETQLYNKAASSCKDEIELYDKMGGIVCLAEKESNFTKVPATYAQFWGGESNYGYVYYDGALDLASMFEYTENFTVFGSDVPCLADCYLGRGNGCTYLENWLSYAGAVSVEQYCTQKWSKIDYAYGALRSCAAKAIAEPADGTTKEEYVEHNQANQNSSNACAYEIWVNDCKALKAKQQVQ